MRNTPNWLLCKSLVWVLFTGVICGLVFISKEKQTSQSPSLGRTLLGEDDNHCTHEKIWNVEDHCQFIKENECETEGYWDRYEFYFCAGDSTLWRVSAFLIMTLSLGIFFYLIGYTANMYFCPTLTTISTKLHLAPDVAGVTLLAFGNGGPDVFSTLAAVKAGSFDMAIGALLGAGLFVTTIIIAGVSFVSNARVMRMHLFRDISFYFIAVIAIILICYDGKIVLWESAALLLYYGSYVTFVVVGHMRKMRKKKRESRLSVNSFELDEDLDDDAPEDATLLRRRSFINTSSHSPLQDGYFAAKSGLYFPTLLDRSSIIEGVFGEKYKEPIDENNFLGVMLGAKFIRAFKQSSWGWRIFFILLSPIFCLLRLTIPVAKAKHWNKYLAVFHPFFSSVIVLVALNSLISSPFSLQTFFWILVGIAGVGTLLGLVIFFTSKPSQAPVYHTIFLVISAISSMSWVFLLANEIVGVLQIFGVIVGISDALLGVSVLAWGNSVSDAVADIVIAKKGLPAMAIAACYGGPLLNLLLGLGVGLTWECLEVTTSANFPVGSYPLPPLSPRIILVGICLCISLLASLVVVPLSGFVIRKSYGIALLTIYGFFVVGLILIEINARIGIV